MSFIHTTYTDDGRFRGVVHTICTSLSMMLPVQRNLALELMNTMWKQEGIKFTKKKVKQKN